MATFVKVTAGDKAHWINLDLVTEVVELKNQTRKSRVHIHGGEGRSFTVDQEAYDIIKSRTP